MSDDDGPLIGLPDVVPIGATSTGAISESGAAMVIEPLRAFLQRKLPKAESLVGVVRDGTNLLPRYGWVMPWGREGSGKTSVLVDLLFHCCAGIDWLGHYAIERPLHIVAIVNEGVPGGLQDKLAQKIERWEGDRDLVLDNLSIYASPWGEFTFADPRMVEHAREYALHVDADYVALDPLHTLGTSGVGAPDETEAFKHVLRAFGVWTDLGVITAHHSNKSGMVSGDWARHPDTVIQLEKDGKNPSTKLTLQKARPADAHELGVPVFLDWEIETLAYTRRTVDASKRTTDDEVLAKVLDELAKLDAPVGMEDLKTLVGGDKPRVARVVREQLKLGDDAKIANVSTFSRRYALVLASTVESDAQRSQRSNEQTRISIGDATVEHSLNGSNGDESLTEGSRPPLDPRTPVGGPTVTVTPDPSTPTPDNPF